MRKPVLAACLAIPVAALAGGPIQDNSFLMEEAYNQEEGVVQHINTFQRLRDSGEWVYTFTQEWPVGGVQHQFSYTIPVLRPSETKAGIGDIALNYRYQLVGDGEAKLAIAPRFSVLVPSGNEKEGRGFGAASLQHDTAISLVLAPELVAHTNLGFTWTPKARDAEGNKADLSAWNAGQSLVWLVSPRVNLLVEAVYFRGQRVAGPGRTSSVETAVVSPGVRWSYDFDSGLQIVPGIAFPIGVGPSRHEQSVFLYLSFEHPFRK
jgi:hypothetical protein